MRSRLLARVSGGVAWSAKARPLLDPSMNARYANLPVELRDLPSAQRCPGLVSGDVDEVVAALAERPANHDLQVGSSVAVVVRRLHDAGVEVHRVARADRHRVALDELRHETLLDDDHLLLPVVPVERMPLARL